MLSKMFSLRKKNNQVWDSLNEELFCKFLQDSQRPHRRGNKDHRAQGMLKSEEPVFPRDDLSDWITNYPISSAQSRDRVHTSNIKFTQQVMFIGFYVYIM